MSKVYYPSPFQGDLRNPRELGDYLRREFIAISNHIQTTDPFVTEQWNDLRSPAESLRVSQNDNKPDYSPIAGLNQSYALLFDPSATETVSVSAQIPHNWKEGSKIIPHIHWTPTTADSGQVRWKFTYSWANVNTTFGAEVTIATTVTCVAHLHHTIASFGEVQDTSKRISSVLLMTVSRDYGHPDDTYPADAAMVSFDIHYQSDTTNGSNEQFHKRL